MPEVIGIDFRRIGKLQLYLCGDIDVAVGEAVVAETKRGIELGEVAKARHSVGGKRENGDFRKILRVATECDLERSQENERRAVDALEICARKIKEHQLPMRLIDAEYTLDRSRITFYFTAETRVDFRQLLRDLYASFKTRIQLLQVGVRDEAKMLGGIGTCGRELCCCSFLRNFDPVGIKMAKIQGLSLNPSKISGVCGRLMCCLRYENEWYDAARGSAPRVGRCVQCEHGIGKVRGVNLLKQSVTVQVDGPTPIEVPASEVTEVDAATAEQLRQAEKQPPREGPPQGEGPRAAREASSSRPGRASRRQRPSREARRPSGTREAGDSPEGSQRPEGPQRPERSQQPERSERPDSSGRPGRPARRDRRGRSRSRGRGGGAGRGGRESQEQRSPDKATPPSGKTAQSTGQAASESRQRPRRRPRRGRRRGPRTEFRTKKTDKDSDGPSKAS